MPRRRPRRAVQTSTPTPYNFPPSGSFDGIDGSWSTFIVNVGSDNKGLNGQDFKVLISTAGSATWVPLQADWCTVPSESECASNRGVRPYQGKQSLGFQTSSSNSWKETGLYDLHLEANLAFGNESVRNGLYGYDNVGLGATSATSPVLASQVVAAISTKDFFMGIFGLSNIPLNLGSSAIQPFIETYRNWNNTPSLTYGYTAGASYRNKGVTGSLVLGGYDASRFTGGKSITMPGGGNSSLVVSVGSITVHPNSPDDDNIYSASGQNTGFFALIDSTLPYLFLPRDICDNFQKIFRLTYDDTTGFYTVNDTSRQYNLAMNPNITFLLGNSLNDNDAINIKLPYDAFDLQAQWPIYPKTTRYFPIRRSPNGYYVLGRTLLQETYLVVDYDRNNFTVAQASFSDPMPSASVVAISPPGTSDSSTPIPSITPKPGSSSQLSAGAIAGIAIAGVVLAIIIAIIIYFFRKQQLKKRQPIQVLNLPDDQHVGTEPPPYDPTKQRRISELETPTPGDVSSRTSTQGYFGSELESPDLSEEMRMKYDAGYFAHPATRLRASSEPQSPGSLNPNGPFELPADHGVSEAGSEPQSPQRTPVLSLQRPPIKRRKKSNGSSGGNHSLQGDPSRVEAIAEDPNEGSPSHEARPLSTILPSSSRFQEVLDDDEEEISSRKHSESHGRPNPGARMSVDEAAGLEGGEPGPILQDLVEPVPRSYSTGSSSTTIADTHPKDETKP